MRYVDPDGRSDWTNITTVNLNPWESHTTIVTWNEYRKVSRYEAYAFSGLMNEFRFVENQSYLTGIKQKWNDSTSNISDFLTILNLLGIETKSISPQGAALLSIITKGLELFSPKQFEKAADMIAAFTREIKDAENAGYTFYDINCDVSTETTIKKSYYPNHPSLEGVKTKYKINFFTTLVDIDKPEDDPNREKFITCVVVFEQ